MLKRNVCINRWLGERERRWETRFSIGFRASFGVEGNISDKTEAIFSFGQQGPRDDVHGSCSHFSFRLVWKSEENNVFSYKFESVSELKRWEELENDLLKNTEIEGESDRVYLKVKISIFLFLSFGDDRRWEIVECRELEAALEEAVSVEKKLALQMEVGKREP